MAVKSLYFKNAAPSGSASSLSLQDGGTAPTGALTTTGWTVAKTVANRNSPMLARTKQIASTFVTTDVIPAFTASSCFRSENPFTGTFANTNWRMDFRVRCSVASSQTGFVKVRLWKSTSADGSGATQLTSILDSGTQTAALSTTVSATSTFTWTPGSTTAFNNEYLWVQVEWTTAVAGGSNTADAVIYVESAGVITTPDFVVPTADAWNVGDKSNVTLSNADKTATIATGSGGVRSTQARLNGAAAKYYAEFALTTGNTPRVGIANLTQGLTATATTLQFQCGAGNITVNGVIVATVAIPAVNDVICVAWDAGAKLVWFRTNSGIWNNDASANPATGVGGFDASALANVDHALWFTSATVGTAVTVRTRIADLTYQGPAGFTSWMGEVIPQPGIADAWNVNDIVLLNLSNGDKTITVTSGSGISQARSTKQQPQSGTDKLYFEVVADALGTALNTTIGINEIATPIGTQFYNSGLKCFGVSKNNNSIIVNGGVQISGGPNFSVGKVISVAYDTVNRRGWIRHSGNNLWNSNAANDPATNVGGYDLSAFNGPMAIAARVYQNDVFTIRTRAAEFTQPIPAGYLSWMGEPTTPATADAWNVYDKSTDITLSNGDKTATRTAITGSASINVRSTTAQTAGSVGKFYAEIRVVEEGGYSIYGGLAPTSADISSGNFYQIPGVFAYLDNGLVTVSGTITKSGLTTSGTNDVFCFAYDTQAKLIWTRLNNSPWNGDASADPATGVGGIDLSSGTGPMGLFATLSGATTGMAVAIRTKAVEFTQPGPTGFTSWMGETLGPPPDAIPAAIPFVDSPPTIPSSTIGQTHVWASTSFAVSALALPAGVLKQEHALPAPLTATAGLPVFGTANLAVQVSIPAATPLAVAAPAIGAATFQQKHVLPIAAPLAVPSPTIVSAAFGQAHALPAATPLAVQPPAFVAGTLKQVHAIAATALAPIAPTLNAPTLGLTSLLSASNLATAPPVEAAALFAQKNVLAAIALASNPPTITAGTLAQAHAFTAIALAVTPPLIASSSIGQAGLLAATPIDVGQPTIAAGALGQKHVLPAASALAASNPALGQPALAAISNFTAISITVALPTIGATVLGKVVAAASLAAASPVLGEPALGKVISAASLAIGLPVLGAPALGQKHIFVASALATNAPLIDSGVLGQAGVLGGLPASAGSPVIGLGLLGQKHVLPLATSLDDASPTLGQPTFSKTFVTLTASSYDGVAPVLGAPAMVRSVACTATPAAAGAPVFTAGTFGQQHLIAAINSAINPATFGVCVFGQKHVLNATPLTVLVPAIPAATLGQAGVMAAIPIEVASPAIGVPAIGQKYVAAAQGLTVGPPALDATSLGKVLQATALAVGAPVISPPLLTKVLTAAPLSAGAPTLGAPACALRVFDLTTSGLAIGPPTIPVLTIGQSGVMAAVPLSVGAPVLGAPALALQHVLSTAGATVGSPLLGAPAIAVRVNATADALTGAAPVLGQGTLRQTHKLIANGCTVASPSLPQATLGAVGVMAAVPLAIGAPVFSVPTFKLNVAAVAALPLAVGAPTLGSAVLGQEHRLIAQAASAGRPVMGAGNVGQAGVMAAIPLWVGSPILPILALHERQRFTGNGFTVGPPFLGIGALGVTVRLPRPQSTFAGRFRPDPAVLGQVHGLNARAASAGAPTGLVATLAIPQVLTAEGFEVGAPGIGAPLFAPRDRLLAVVDITSRQRLTPIIGRRPSVTISNTQRAAPLTGERNSRATIIGRRDRNVI